MRTIAREYGRRMRARASTGFDRCAIDQPTDHADVGPGQRGVVENAGVFGFAGEQGVDHFFARVAPSVSAAW